MGETGWLRDNRWGHAMEMTRTDIDTAERFAFGENWSRFLELLDEERIAEAEASLERMLGPGTLAGKRFLDIGSGSGLFSLAAHRLGAHVRSFDFDPQSVACAHELRRRYADDLDPRWRVGQGSVLDGDFMARLGTFDVVYSWGVLHHTGSMWVALENALQRVAPGGRLFIAIYNDQGWWSRVWWLIKYYYLKLPRVLRTPYAYAVSHTLDALNIIKQTLKLQPMVAIRPLLDYKPGRGMSRKHDLLDWMGGFPFEVARYEVLVDYMNARGFSLLKGMPNRGSGCHELVFERRTQDMD